MRRKAIFQAHPLTHISAQGLPLLHPHPLPMGILEQWDSNHLYLQTTGQHIVAYDGLETVH